MASGDAQGVVVMEGQQLRLVVHVGLLLQPLRLLEL